MSSTSWKSICYLAWNFIFDRRCTEREIEVLSVSSLFLMRVGVYVRVCACIRTYTYTMHMKYSDVSLGVGTRHLEPEESKKTKSWHICIRICVRVYTC